jgi:hypothetical protein
MLTKTKTFDCVEMKRRSQIRLYEEYKERRGEFESYLDFIHAKARESAWVRKQRKRLHAG